MGVQQLGEIGKAEACLRHFKVSLAACIRIRALGSTDIDFGFGSIFGRRSHCHSSWFLRLRVAVTSGGEMYRELSGP
jgi:hypothetical protein